MRRFRGWIAAGLTLGPASAAYADFLAGWAGRGKAIVLAASETGG